jgi:hypothetical protein
VLAATYCGARRFADGAAAVLGIVIVTLAGERGPVYAGAVEAFVGCVTGIAEECEPPPPHATRKVRLVMTAAEPNALRTVFTKPTPAEECQNAARSRDLRPKKVVVKPP